jgi:hypothetical protein
MPLGPRDDLTRSAIASAPTMEACAKASGRAAAKRGEWPAHPFGHSMGACKRYSGRVLVSVCRRMTPHSHQGLVHLLTSILLDKPLVLHVREGRGSVRKRECAPCEPARPWPPDCPARRD